MSDSISDFLTIIRNSYSAGQTFCQGKYSRIHLRIAQILKEEGYIREVEEATDNNGHKVIKMTLKYVDDVPAITGLMRHSSPGRRLYYGYQDIPRILGGLGIGILTTSKGILRDREARQQKVGGEMICTVW